MKFQLNQDPENRKSVIRYMKSQIEQLPLDQSFQIKVEPLKEIRRHAQNALMWVWNTEIGQHYGKTSEQVHAEDKLGILLPLMLETERLRDDAIFIRELLLQLAQYKHKVWAADKWLRTSELHVREFTQYLERRQYIWAERGFVLSSNNQHYDEAMGRKAA